MVDVVGPLQLGDRFLDRDTGLQAVADERFNLLALDVGVGNFVTDDEQDAYLVLSEQLLRWSPAGYERPIATLHYPLRVVTPASIVRTLAAGYPAGIHASAFAALDQSP